ncbi:MAG: nicotinamide riboside transporter PnuC [Verrucomicrobiota bacterium]
MEEALRNIWTGITTSSPLDLANLVLGITGVWLMIKRSLWAFPVGLVAVTVQGVLFWRATFYADAKLQVFFFVCLCYGWWHWTRDQGDASELPVTALRWRTRAIYVAATAALWLGWGSLQAAHTDATQPYRDTFIAAFSIAGQILQVRKHLENWIAWIAVNTVAVIAYWSADLAFTAFLYAVFLVMALLGLRDWRRAWKKESVARG